MELLKIPNGPADKQFKTNPPENLLAAFSERIADELRKFGRPDKGHLIEEIVKLTLRLNQLKNQMRSGGDDGYNTRNDYLEYLSSSAKLYRLLVQIGITPMGSDTGIFAADLCVVARKCIEASLTDMPIDRFYPC